MKYDRKICEYCSDVITRKYGRLKRIVTVHYGENYPCHCIRHEPLPQKFIDEAALAASFDVRIAGAA